MAALPCSSMRFSDRPIWPVAANLAEVFPARSKLSRRANHLVLRQRFDLDVLGIERSSPRGRPCLRSQKIPTPAPTQDDQINCLIILSILRETKDL